MRQLSMQRSMHSAKRAAWHGRKSAMRSASAPAPSCVRAWVAAWKWTECWPWFAGRVAHPLIRHNTVGAPSFAFFKKGGKLRISTAFSSPVNSVCPLLTTEGHKVEDSALLIAHKSLRHDGGILHPSRGRVLCYPTLPQNTRKGRAPRMYCSIKVDCLPDTSQRYWLPRSFVCSNHFRKNYS